MISFPNAKINIGLNITGKRQDGFHDIETVFYPVKLCDILEIVENPSGSHMPLYHNTGIPVEVSLEKNLCVKAYRLLQKDFKLPEISIHLHKIIPFGAGLGGGSSDAVFTIQLLNKLFSLKLDNSKLLQYTLNLGSDCAFFTENKPVIARGRGEVLEPVSLNLSGKHIIIVKPSFGISTVEAYAEVVPKNPPHKLSESIQKPIDKLTGLIENDFENSLFKKHPELSNIKDKLYRIGASYASLSGSGSAIYGIFNDECSFEGWFPGCFVWGGVLE